MTKAERDSIKAKILQRRCQVFVHSVIYYRLNDNLISDSQWSKWAKELCDLQNTYPQISKSAKFLYEEFKNFDHSTGMSLPLDDEWAVAKAEQLLRYKRKY